MAGSSSRKPRPANSSRSPWPAPPRCPSGSGRPAPAPATSASAPRSSTSAASSTVSSAGVTVRAGSGAGSAAIAARSSVSRSSSVCRRRARAARSSARVLSFSLMRSCVRLLAKGRRNCRPAGFETAPEVCPNVCPSTPDRGWATRSSESFRWSDVVARAGIEPATFRFSGGPGAVSAGPGPSPPGAITHESCHGTPSARTHAHPTRTQTKIVSAPADRQLHLSARPRATAYVSELDRLDHGCPPTPARRPVG